ncbi:MAG: CHAD domain-containing protein [Planctomycetaceae bacterium]|nr:CHAD domain-containing protein [Planctomycetaceae bacterium]
MSDVDVPTTDSAASGDLPLHGQTPLSATARPVLQKRLRKVARRIAQCARAADLSPDDVHELRVAIRRCAAALDTFRPLLSKRRSKRFRKRLKQIRKAAGEVRDLDIVLERLLTAQLDPAAVDAAGTDDWLDRRHRAIRALRRAARDEVDCELKRRAKGLVRRVRWRGDGQEPTIATAAPGLLRPIADRCRKYGTCDLTAVRKLHQFRVHVKLLRYASEFVQPGLNADSCRTLQEILSDLQQKLGSICDRVATIRLLNGPDFAHQEDAADLVAREQAALTGLQTGFITWWESEGRNRFEQAIDENL